MPLLATKVKNLLKNEDYEFKIRDIRINGTNRGCSGFVTSKTTGKTIYLNTEDVVYQPLQNKILVRTAKDDKDYIGGPNQWVTIDELGSKVASLLT